MSRRANLAVLSLVILALIGAFGVPPVQASNGPRGATAPGHVGNAAALLAQLSSPTPTATATPPPMIVTKTASPDPVAVGGQLTYTIRISATTPGIPLVDVVLTDNLPAGVGFVQLSISQGLCQTAPPNLQSGQVVCNLGQPIQPGNAATLTLVVQPLAAAAGTTVTNTVQVVSSTGGSAAASTTTQVSGATATATAGTATGTATATSTASATATRSATATATGTATATATRTATPTNTRTATVTVPPAAGVSFAPAAEFLAGGDLRGAAAADLNGDGRPDLAIASAQANNVAVLLNTTAPGATTPSFAPAATFVTDGSPQAVALADVNGDGRPDLLVADTADVAVLLNTTAPGATTPSFAPAAFFGSGGSIASAIAVADVNGDGRPDLLVTNALSNPNPAVSVVGVLLNTTAPGATTPSFAPAATFGTGGSSAAAVVAADVNGDGRSDLLLANFENVGVLLNTTVPGATTPSFAPAATFGTGGSEAFAVVAADVNGDGRPDLLVANDLNVGVLLNTTAPGATTPSFAPATSYLAGTNLRSVAAADVNGDGRPDLLVTTSNNVAVLLNQTAPGALTPGFGPAATFGAGSSPRAVVASDVNGDGRPDLLVGTGGSNTVSVLLNTTVPFGRRATTFGSTATFGTGNTPAAVAGADVNGDGRPDLLVANSGANTVSVLLNLTAPGAAPSFAPAADFLVGSTPRALTAVDVNGDGRPDLLVANSGANTVSVLLNLTAPGAAPSFAPAASFGVGSSPVSVAAVDVNGDGRPDLIVANSGANTVSVLLNQTAPGGAPSFAPAVSFGAGINPAFVAAVDVNGDGRPDLFVTNPGFNTLLALLNTTAPGATTPSFAAAENIGAGNSPASVTAADVNGDGRPDLIVASNDSNTVSVLLNLTAPGATLPSFAVATSFGAGSGPQGVAAADVNGDGRPDLLVANQSSNNISVLLNTTAPGATTPSFAAAVNAAAGTAPAGVTATDVNGDGCPDLLVANGGANNAAVLLNSCRDLILQPLPTVPPSVTPVGTPVGTPTATPTGTRTPTATPAVVSGLNPPSGSGPGGVPCGSQVGQVCTLSGAVSGTWTKTGSGTFRLSATGPATTAPGGTPRVFLPTTNGVESALCTPVPVLAPFGTICTGTTTGDLRQGAVVTVRFPLVGGGTADVTGTVTGPGATGAGAAAAVTTPGLLVTPPLLPPMLPSALPPLLPPAPPFLLPPAVAPPGVRMAYPEVPVVPEA